jgi:hypothetical protein
MILTDVRNQLFCLWTVDKREESKLPMWRTLHRVTVSVFIYGNAMFADVEGT